MIYYFINVFVGFVLGFEGCLVVVGCGKSVGLVFECAEVCWNVLGCVGW